VTSFRLTQNWWEGEKSATAKYFSFYKQLSTSLSSMLSFWSLEHVWLKIIWLKSNRNPSGVVVKRLVGSHLDKISWME